MGAATFELRHPRGTTTVFAGAGALESAAPWIFGELAGRPLYAVSSAPILARHRDGLARVASAARSLEVFEVPDGEAAKSLEVASDLHRRLARSGAKRDGVLAAFGGGSVGDLTGFVAGTYLRGVAFLQLPTTLLAQVDAAIGGKTGVDLPEAKNAVGLFHHPRVVVAEAAWLATLPADEIRSGLVEAIKTAALLDPALLDRIESELDELRRARPTALGPIVEAAARAKARLVESDPEEAGARALLNFGHTLGHALETAAGYGRLRHGDAVAHGIRFALVLARSRGLEPGFGARLGRLLDRLSIPPLPPLDAARLVDLMARDKKARESGLGWVLALAPGRAEYGVPISAGEVSAELASFLAGREPARPL